MPDIEARMKLSFPVTNMPSDRTTKDGRYVELTIEDGASGETLVRVALSPDEWMALGGTEITRVPAQTSDHLERVGSRCEHSTNYLGRGVTDEAIAAAVNAARADGWDEVTVGSSNRGPVVHCQRWTAPKTEV